MINNVEQDINSARQLFTSVRDIPYGLGCEGNTNDLLKDGVGECGRKHLYLYKKLQELDYQVEIGMAVFDWRSLPIPHQILALLTQPVQYHMFLYAGKDVPSYAIDATWDPQMAPLGFRVFDWDGESGTGIAVDPISVKRLNFTELKIRAFASKLVKHITHSSQNGSATPFNDAFNGWLHQNRENTSHRSK